MNEENQELRRQIQPMAAFTVSPNHKKYAGPELPVKNAIFGIKWVEEYGQKPGNLFKNSNVSNVSKGNLENLIIGKNKGKKSNFNKL